MKEVATTNLPTNPIQLASPARHASLPPQTERPKPHVPPTLPKPKPKPNGVPPPNNNVSVK